MKICHENQGKLSKGMIEEDKENHSKGEHYSPISRVAYTNNVQMGGNKSEKKYKLGKEPNFFFYQKVEEGK